MTNKFCKNLALVLALALTLALFPGPGYTASADLPVDADNGDWAAKHVTLRDTGEAELMVRVGDIDLNNYPDKIEDGFNPFTSEDRVTSWPGRDLDPTDPDGTDRYYLGSVYTGSPSGDGAAGYWRQWKAGTGYQDQAFGDGAATITFAYDASGITVKNAEIQLYVNDFQSSYWDSDFTATLNGRAWPALSAALNVMLQTGAYLGWVIQPVPAEFLPDIASGNFVLTIDEVNGAGDGYAIDFVKLLVNKYNTATPPLLSDGTNAPPSTITIGNPLITTPAAVDPIPTEIGPSFTLPASTEGIGFRLFRSTNIGERGIDVAGFTIQSTEFIDVNVSPNTTYYYSLYEVTYEADQFNEIYEDTLIRLIQQWTVTTPEEILGGGATTPGQKHFISMELDSPYMTVDGLVKEIDPGRGTVATTINSRTMVPIRAIAEEIGGANADVVGWDDATQTVTIELNSLELKMTIGSKICTVNGQDMEMDVAPAIINERTLLPLRFFGENLGYTVSFLSTKRQAVVVFTM